MSRQPFITADLRPDLAVESDSMGERLNEQSPSAQLAEAAHVLLTEEERRQIDRGVQSRHQRLMDSIPCPNPNVQGTTLDGETVLLDLCSGRYYTLNRVGTAIWEHCTGNNSLRSIHEALCKRFEAPAERIADDLFALVTQLGHEGLLTIDGR